MSSQPTDLSLVMRVRARDQRAWHQFTEIYGPMVYGWARQAGVQPSDARDLGQEVFVSVMESLDQWQPGQFRPWLWTIFRRRLMDFYRRLESQPRGSGGTTANLIMQQVPESVPDEASQQGRVEIEEVRRRALEIVSVKVDSRHWQAFYRVVINGELPANVAEDMGVSKWFVYKAKSRVMHKLIGEFEGMDLLDQWIELNKPR